MKVYAFTDKKIGKTIAGVLIGDNKILVLYDDVPCYELRVRTPKRYFPEYEITGDELIENLEKWTANISMYVNAGVDVVFKKEQQRGNDSRTSTRRSKG